MQKNQKNSKVGPFQVFFSPKTSKQYFSKKKLYAKIKESSERQFFIIQTLKMADLTISEERLKTLIEEMFKEELEKQQRIFKYH